jgi:hypothetical protein
MSIHTAFFFIALIVLFCSESDKAFSIYIHSQWIIACHHHIDSQIKFMPVKEQRVINVSRNYASFMLWHKLWFINDKYTFTLRRCGRFYNPHVWLVHSLNVPVSSSVFSNFVLILVILLIELIKLVRKDKGLWNEVEICFRIPFLHLNDILSKSVFPCEFKT